MKVSLLIPGWPPEDHANGVVTASAHLLEALGGDGVEVRALAWQGKSSPSGSTPQVVLVPSANRRRGLARVGRSLEWGLDPGRTGRRQAAERVANLLESIGGNSAGDVLEVEESHGWVSELARFCAVTTAVALHGPWFIHGPMSGEHAGEVAYRDRVRAEGQALRAADLIIAPSREVLRRAVRYYDLRRHLACVVPYAFPVRDPQERWRRDLCEAEHVLFVGRYDRHKGGDLALAAFSAVARRRPRARMTFVGPDAGITDESGRLWHLREYAEHCLPGSIRSGQITLTGRQAPAEIERLRLSAAVTLSCSRWENLSLAVIEAMSAGCPVIVADQGGLKDHIKDGVSGMLFRSGSVSHLAACIERMLDDPDLAASMGRAAAEHVERELDPAKVAARRLEAYRQVLRTRASGQVR